jgi:hypothetical protein
MSCFNHFDDLDEVAAFGDYLVKVEAIPEGGFLHLRTKPVEDRRNKWAWGEACQDAFSHAARLADEFPDQYRSFKTLRRLTT